MKALVKKTKTKTYINFNNEIFVTNHDWSNFQFEKVDFNKLHEQQTLSINDKSGWCEVGEFETIENAYFAYIGLLKKEQGKRRTEKEKFIATLEPFWKDVDSRVGMDVCTPFINRFPGHSFVTYDKGFIWSKTLKAVFKLKDFSGSKAYFPKSYMNVYSFGAKLE